ncbi:hypothetical protein WJX72_005185 [[Myrmecia] bisecta]|uniref:Uncharacterized protein n=1 Tax=[Myrmecia] bisecta TaxID=41462 RepID=A0AAW1QQM8_9CHLO
MLLAISSRSRRDSFDHSRLLRNECRSPVSVQHSWAAAALACRQHQEVLLRHTLDVSVCQAFLNHSSDWLACPTASRSGRPRLRARDESRWM